MFNGVTHNNYESGYVSSNSQCVLVHFTACFICEISFLEGKYNKNKISSNPETLSIRVEKENNFIIE